MCRALGPSPYTTYKHSAKSRVSGTEAALLDEASRERAGPFTLQSVQHLGPGPVY